MDSRILRRTMVQKSSPVIYGLEMLLSGDDFTSTSATRQVSFEA